MNKTSIEWTTFSANPLKYRDPAGNVVWGCVHASPGCQHCYSEALAKRYGRGGPFQVSVMNGLTPFLDDGEMHKMLTAKTIGGIPVSGSRCFIGDMTDIFGEWVPDELLDRLFAVLALRRDVTWQLLTKRAGRMRDYMASRSKSADYWKRAAPTGCALEWEGISLVPFPLSNVWLGVSVEDQQRADERIPLLLQTPVAVRFISAEPLLAPVNLADSVFGYCDGCGTCPDACAGLRPGRACCPDCRHRSLDWVIVGGESGSGSRPMEVAWAKDIVKQCRSASVPVFLKQLGTVPLVPAARLRHYEWGEGKFEHWQNDRSGLWRVKLLDRKGGDPTEWPADLRVREYPQ